MYFTLLKCLVVEPLLSTSQLPLALTIESLIKACRTWQNYHIK